MTLFHNLLGPRYSGKFEIETHSQEFGRTVDDHYAYYTEEYTINWFDGLGVITDLKDCGKASFRFNPLGDSEKNIIILDKDVRRDAIRDYSSVVDMSLGLMYKSAIESDGVVPRINLPILTLDMLAEKELMILNVVMNRK